MWVKTAKDSLRNLLHQTIYLFLLFTTIISITVNINYFQFEIKVF